jgi:hypothetical protein
MGCVIVMIMRVVFMGCVIVMIVVIMLGFQRGAGLHNAALSGLRHDKQIKRTGQRGHGAVNGSAVLSGCGGIFKAHNVRAGRAQSHRDLATIKSDVELSDTMFMRAQLAVIFGENGGGGDQCANCQRGCNFHGGMILC